MYSGYIVRGDARLAAWLQQCPIEIMGVWLAATADAYNRTCPTLKVASCPRFADHLLAACRDGVAVIVNDVGGEAGRAWQPSAVTMTAWRRVRREVWPLSSMKGLAHSLASRESYTRHPLPLTAVTDLIQTQRQAHLSFLVP